MQNQKRIDEFKHIPVTTIFFSLQNSISFSWVKYGWHSTWLTVGGIFAMARMRSICCWLKLDTPIDLTLPVQKKIEKVIKMEFEGQYDSIHV